jgi:hypothetical protein
MTPNILNEGMMEDKVLWRLFLIKGEDVRER